MIEIIATKLELDNAHRRSSYLSVVNTHYNVPLAFS